MKYSEIVNTESNQMNAEKVDKFLEDHGLQLEWLNNLIINYSEFNDQYLKSLSGNSFAQTLVKYRELTGTQVYE